MDHVAPARRSSEGGGTVAPRRSGGGAVARGAERLRVARGAEPTAPDAPPGEAQDRVAPPGGAEDHVAPPGGAEDHVAPPGEAQDHVAPPGGAHVAPPGGDPTAPDETNAPLAVSHDMSPDAVVPRRGEDSVPLRAVGLQHADVGLQHQQRLMSPTQKADLLRRATDHMYHSADQELLKRCAATNSNENHYAASTAVTLLVWEDLLCVGHLGDSRVCLIYVREGGVNKLRRGLTTPPKATASMDGAPVDPGVHPGRDRVDPRVDGVDGSVRATENPPSPDVVPTKERVGNTSGEGGGDVVPTKERVGNTSGEGGGEHDLPSTVACSLDAGRVDGAAADGGRGLGTADKKGASAVEGVLPVELEKNVENVQKAKFNHLFRNAAPLPKNAAPLHPLGCHPLRTDSIPLSKVSDLIAGNFITAYVLVVLVIITLTPNCGNAELVD